MLRFTGTQSPARPTKSFQLSRSYLPPTAVPGGVLAPGEAYGWVQAGTSGSSTTPDLDRIEWLVRVCQQLPEMLALALV